MTAAQGKNLGIWWGWPDGVSGWGPNTNNSLQILDTIVQLGVIDNTLTVPPTTPSEGDRYIVGKTPAPSGDWLNHADDVAAFLSGSWVFFTPKAGWTAFSGAAGRVEWNGTAWQKLQAGIPDAPQDGVGYARQDGGWVPVSTGGGIPEAPNDGKQYARKEQGWSEVQIPSLALGGLSDVKITSVVDQQTIVWDAASSKWVNKAAGGGSMASLSDVVLSSQTDGQVIAWDAASSKWVNRTVSSGGIPDAPTDGKQYTRGGTGSASWNPLNVFGGSGGSHATGLVPDPGATAGTTKYLREDGNWSAPPYPVAMGASGPSHAAGLVPDPGAAAGTTRYLREDGTFAVPPGSGGGVPEAPNDGVKYMRRNGSWSSFFTTVNPYGAHAFWRINCSAAVASGLGMRVAELRFFDPKGVQIPTTGGNATGSAQNTTFGPANAFDGNTTTYYRSNSAPIVGAPIFLAYQFTAAQAVARVQIAVTDVLTGGPSTFTVDYSDDGSTWTTAWTVTGAGPYTDQVFIDFSSPDVSVTSDDQLRWLGDVKLTALADGHGVVWSASQGKFVNTALAKNAAFGPSGASHAMGLVPDPGATAGTTKFLREDGNWAQPGGGPAVTSTVGGLVLLSRQVLSATAASVVLNPPASGYSRLMVKVVGRTAGGGTANDAVRATFNGSASNHSCQLLQQAANGASATGFQPTSNGGYVYLGELCAVNAPAGQSSCIEMMIDEYASSSLMKTGTARSATQYGTTTATMYNAFCSLSFASAAPITTVTLAAGATGTSGFAAGTVIEMWGYASTPAISGATVSFRNEVMDGNFDFWSLGTTWNLTAGQGRYVTDVWSAYVSNTVGAAATVLQVPVTPGGDPSYMSVPRRFKLRWSQTGAGGGVFYQRFENVRRWAGRSITISVTLSASVAGNWITQLKVNQNFGYNGGASSTVFNTKDIAWALASGERRYSFRFDVPSIAGKTIGTDGGDFVEFQFQMATTGTFDIDFSQVQIEDSDPASSPDATGLGGAPTTFEYRGLGVERVRVLRFLKVFSFGGFAVAATGVNQSDTSSVVPMMTSEPMRTNPSITQNGMAINQGGSQYPISSVSGGSSLDNQALLLNCAVTGVTGGSPVLLQATSGGGSIILDARL